RRATCAGKDVAAARGSFASVRPTTIKTSMLTVRLAIKTAEIYTCAFAPDGARALIGSQGNPVGLWDLTSSRLLREHEHAGPGWALAWSGDQRCFLSLDGTMRLWDV